ncbi:hypothetical protein SAMN05216262_101537 [Colwellia chukchiensis]|uniref:Uncharacterized protein n=1 Tax=Colwellia chukchiensis TaxID=641665 RepID=A0A1H7HLY3_9GAMM|nr:hypothetical protein [Colwellia chukchiensis]SEK51158.1 hypothetical protein SAMN05216262_101537 [Colwellia chukchiensis]
MNKQIKITLSITLLSTLGLYNSNILAAPHTINNALASISAYQLVPKVPSLAGNSAYPSLTSEVFISYPSQGFISLPKAPVKPLAGIEVVDFAIITPNGIQKKNSIFEFAAKFNDTLQQILAFFDLSSAESDGKNKSYNESPRAENSYLISQVTAKKPITTCRAKSSS